MTPILTRSRTTLAIALGLPWPACVWLLVWGPEALGRWTYAVVATVLVATAGFAFVTRKTLESASRSCLPVTRT